jgi:hypothetical protein
MSILNSITGTETEIKEAQSNKELSGLLVEGETVQSAFKSYRDMFAFTNYRLILVDKQGMTGKKVEYRSIPYTSITSFSVQTAGSMLDRNVEVFLWLKGGSTFTKSVHKNTDIVGLQRTLAAFVLNELEK